MSANQSELNDLEAAVAQLNADHLSAFAKWFQEHLDDAWDRQIEADSTSGRLDHLLRQADDDFELRRSMPREGWAGKFAEMSRNGDDKPLDSQVTTLSSFDELEWEWE